MRSRVTADERQLELIEVRGERQHVVRAVFTLLGHAAGVDELARGVLEDIGADELDRIRARATEAVAQREIPALVPRFIRVAQVSGRCLVTSADATRPEVAFHPNPTAR